MSAGFAHFRAALMLETNSIVSRAGDGGDASTAPIMRKAMITAPMARRINAFAH